MSLSASSLCSALATNRDRTSSLWLWSTDKLALWRRARTMPMPNACTSAMAFLSHRSLPMLSHFLTFHETSTGSRKRLMMRSYASPNVRMNSYFFGSAQCECNPGALS